MKNANTYWVLLGVSFAALVASLTGILSESFSALPMAMGISLIICQLAGKFKAEDPLDSDQKDFVDRMVKEAENLKEGCAVINILNAEGKESKIIINVDGSIEFEGDPDPDILNAARGLKDTIIQYGPEIVAAELLKRLHGKS